MINYQSTSQMCVRSDPVESEDESILFAYSDVLLTYFYVQTEHQTLLPPIQYDFHQKQIKQRVHCTKLCCVMKQTMLKLIHKSLITNTRVIYYLWQQPTNNTHISLLDN